ncbi:murein biosynthesis integral membrane protein MurJ [Enterococcus sp. BWR-S5]|uniref:murein biosynthesis integral membrane protein MurJ n=1 Tax=Enterococcus sp. BWR-S5 TaxID=2787714 RepID=UPI0019229837|nr:murein biosynthesis integral membrane protein MurJ [Enterococcus sp. BWR-S5]MBL1224732.1 murein biosynthesis integral membrane protein MurJ [Enterococcus sp. BWR-S5]
MQKVNMKKMAFLLMIITLLSKVFGFCRDLVLSYYYGVSEISDAYLVSQTIPTVIFDFLAIGISTAFIPIYTKILKHENKKSADKFTNLLLKLAMMFCLVMVVLVLIFTKQIVSVFASGFDESTLEIAVRFTRISIFGIFFTALISIFTPYLQVNNKFIGPAVATIPLNIIVMLSIVLSHFATLETMVIGTVFASFVQFFIIRRSVKSTDFTVSLSGSLNNTYIKEFSLAAFPVILGTSVNQLNILIDQTLASQVSVGGISALNYSNRLIGFIQGIFVLSITTAVFPMFSKLYLQNKIAEYKKSIIDSTGLIIFMVLPISLIFMFFSTEIVTILFGRGQFELEAVTLTSETLHFFSIGLLGFGLREVFSRAFYALGDTRTPMINATLGIVVKIMLNFVFIQFFGIGGLALATSISAIFTTLLLIFFLRKKIGSLEAKSFAGVFTKIVGISIAMVVITKFSYSFILTIVTAKTLVAFALTLIVGVIFYLIASLLLKVPYVKDLTNLLKR